MTPLIYVNLNINYFMYFYFDEYATFPFNLTKESFGN